MNRLHLLELSDQPWLPEVWRSGMICHLNWVAKAGRHHRTLAPLLEGALRASGARRIVDLAAGGGGPVIAAFRALAADDPKLSLRLADIRPCVAALEAQAAAGPEDIEVVRDPVDATCVPQDLEGVRVLVNALHHLRPEEARGVLRDAVRARQPIVVAEMLARHPMIVLLNLFSWTSVVLSIPFLRPFRPAWLLWGWVLPAIPICFTFDAVVSALRIYGEDALRALIADADPEHEFMWEIRRIRLAPSPLRSLAVVGVPRR